MKTSTSSIDRSKTFKENHIPPLTAQFFSTLIKLETDFVNKQYTAETLDQLTEYYAQAVEYYDAQKDPISTYFIFKIQDMLTTKKSLKLLMHESAKAAAHGKDSANNQSISTATPPNSAGFMSSPEKGKNGMENGIPDMIMETVGDNSSSSEDEEEEEDKVKDLMGKHHHHHRGKKKIDLSAKNAGKSIVAMKNMKQKLFSLQLKIQKEKAHEKQSLTEVLASFTKCCQHNDQVVTKDINSQRNRIRNRVARKNKEGIINKTHSSSGFFQFRGDITIESMLKGLEDEDSSQNPLSNSVNEEFSDGNQKAQSEGLAVEQL